MNTNRPETITPRTFDMFQRMTAKNAGSEKKQTQTIR